MRSDLHAAGAAAWPHRRRPENTCLAWSTGLPPVRVRHRKHQDKCHMGALCRILVGHIPCQFTHPLHPLGHLLGHILLSTWPVPITNTLTHTTLEMPCMPCMPYMFCMSCMSACPTSPTGLTGRTSHTSPAGCNPSRSSWLVLHLFSLFFLFLFLFFFFFCPFFLFSLLLSFLFSRVRPL